MNVSIADAAFLLDLDFPGNQHQGTGIPILARTAGLPPLLPMTHGHRFLMASHGEAASATGGPM